MTKQYVTSLGNKLKTLALVQSEASVNIFPPKEEAASLAFTIPFHLDTHRKTLGLSSELSAFFYILLLPVQRSVWLPIPTFSYGRRGLLYRSLAPTRTEMLPQLPTCLPPGHTEM